MTAKTPDQFSRDLREILGSVSCPSPEKMIQFLDGELSAEDSTSLEIHLNDCPSCIGEMAQLNRSDESLKDDKEYLAQSAKDRERIAAILGFEQRQTGSLLSKVEWLWKLNTPLFLPAGLTAALCLVLFLGQEQPAIQTASVTDTPVHTEVAIEPEPEVEIEAPRAQLSSRSAVITLDSFFDRYADSDADEDIRMTCTVGQEQDFDIGLDPGARYDLRKPVRIDIVDPAGQIVVDQQERIHSKHMLELRAVFVVPGVHRLRIYDPAGAKVKSEYKIKVLPAADDPPPAASR